MTVLCREFSIGWPRPSPSGRVGFRTKKEYYFLPASARNPFLRVQHWPVYSRITFGPFAVRARPSASCAFGWDA